MAEIFNPSWVSCLNKSVRIFFNRWTCAEQMFVQRKPHPFGNNYIIDCGKSGILYAMEIVEGKDHPKELPDDPKMK